MKVRKTTHSTVLLAFREGNFLLSYEEDSSVREGLYICPTFAFLVLNVLIAGDGDHHRSLCAASFRKCSVAEETEHTHVKGETDLEEQQYTSG